MGETLFQTDAMTADVSPCGTYRYTLGRKWGECPTLGWCMLNPSTADASVDDPTIRRCVAFAKQWGYGGLVVVNLFALRATDPAALARHPAPVGMVNDEAIRDVAMRCPVVVAAWGAHGFAARRARAVADVLTSEPVRAQWSGNQTLYCLGTTKDGSPRHPLYVASATPLVPWHPAADLPRQRDAALADAARERARADALAAEVARLRAGRVDAAEKT